LKLAAANLAVLAGFAQDIRSWLFERPTDSIISAARPWLTVMLRPTRCATTSPNLRMARVFGEPEVKVRLAVNLSLCSR